MLFNAVYTRISWLFNKIKINILKIIVYRSRDQVFHILQGETHITRSLSLLESQINAGVIESNFVLIDIGAYIGQTTKMFVEKFPQNRVFCFEPLKNSFFRLQKNTRFYQNVFAYNLAIGNHNGTVSLYVTEMEKASSLLVIDNNYLRFQNKYLSSLLAPRREESVQMDTLDNIMFSFGEINIGLLKIDVQGGELLVLDGAKETLKRTKIVVLEMSNHNSYKGSPKYFEVDAKMRICGFELYDLIPSIWNYGRIYEWNSIYLRTSTECQQ
jgi:FkbM family methyltransferase